VEIGETTEMDALLSVSEAALRLGGLSKHTINAWLSSGKLRRTKVGSRTMIHESELQRVIQEGGKSVITRKAKSKIAVTVGAHSLVPPPEIDRLFVENLKPAVSR
jgi:excisionase family DNA binding protein